MSVREIPVTSSTPGHLIWTAAQHAHSKDVRISMMFVSDKKKEWRFFNNDIRSVGYADETGHLLLINLRGYITLTYDVRSREGMLREER